MVVEGLKLMVLGMLTVYAFLFLLFYAVEKMGAYFGEYARKEGESQDAIAREESQRVSLARKKEEEKQRSAIEKIVRDMTGSALSGTGGPSGNSAANLVAVVSAAIQQHRAK